MHRKLLSAILCLFTLVSFAKELVLIQGAMDIEIDYLIKAIGNPKEERVGAWTFWIGKINEHDVVISRTEIGLINAAASTAIAILKYEPTLIINQGTAGGHAPTLHRGDLVIGESFINIGAMQTNSDKSEFFDVVQRLRDNENNPENNAAFYSNKKLLAISNEIMYPHGKKAIGVIGSADQWNKGAERINYLRKTFNTSAEDMESVAAAQVASSFNIPFFGFRVLSNAELHGESFKPETARWAQVYATALISSNSFSSWMAGMK